jgi:drug/metabolite transporter (DMT)-like permease
MGLTADLTLLLIPLTCGSAFVAQRVAGQLNSVYLFNSVRYLLTAVVLPLAIKVHPVGRVSIPNGANLTYAIQRNQYKWMFIAGFFFICRELSLVGARRCGIGGRGDFSSLH